MSSNWILAIVCIVTTLISNWLTRKSLRYAHIHGIVDDPNSNPKRKQQKSPIPLLGATGFVCTALFFSGIVWVLKDSSYLALGTLLDLNNGDVRIGWIAASIIVLMVGGYFDDKFHLSAKWMFFPISLALLMAIIGGNLEISALSYPFDTIVPDWEIVPKILAFLWLGLCLAATKFLDGHDGLVTTVGVIALLTIASVSMFNQVFQPLTFAMAVIWGSSLLGFLPYNFPDAKAYLGEGGSEVIGFVIGVLSIISGAKIATVATVIGWFILDVVLVLAWRYFAGRSLFEGDRLHWHFRLVDIGFNKLQVLVLTTMMLLITAQIGLYVPTEDKPILLFSQFVFLVGIACASLILILLKKHRVSEVKAEKKYDTAPVLAQRYGSTIDTSPKIPDPAAMDTNKRGNKELNQVEDTRNTHYPKKKRRKKKVKKRKR